MYCITGTREGKVWCNALHSNLNSAEFWRTESDWLTDYYYVTDTANNFPRSRGRSLKLGYEEARSEQLEATRASEFVKDKDVFISLPTGSREIPSISSIVDVRATELTKQSWSTRHLASQKIELRCASSAKRGKLVTAAMIDSSWAERN